MIIWAYVAGFFDGEGSLDLRGRRIAIYQRDDGCLKTIAQWLMEHEVKCKVDIRKTPRKTNFLVIGQESCLRISDFRSTYRFLREIRPYVIVKKQKVEDLWRFYTMYPKLDVSTVGRLGRQYSTSKFGSGWHYKIRQDPKTGRFIKCA